MHGATIKVKCYVALELFLFLAFIRPLLLLGKCMFFGPQMKRSVSSMSSRLPVLFPEDGNRSITRNVFF